MPFGAALGSFLAYEGAFGATLEALWGHFGGTLGSLWSHLGSLWLYSDDFGSL